MSINVQVTQPDDVNLTITTGNAISVNVGLNGDMHNSLVGLQGGSSNQFYHLSSAQYANLTTGAVVRPSETGIFVTENETGAFYPSTNPSGFITGVDLSAYVTGDVVRPSETGIFITESETGAFYPTSNPSGFITGVDLSSYVTGDVVRPSETGAFYAASNPSGFITGIDLSAYVTGDVVRPSETGSFITSSQTGLFYASSNPSGFITGVDLSAYVTGSVVRPSETGIFVTENETGVFYPVSNPSGFITGVDLSAYVTGDVVRPSETGNFITNSQTGAFYPVSNPSGFVTGAVVRPSETGSFLTTGAADVRYVGLTGNQDISGLKDFQTRPTVLDTPVLISGDAVDTIHLYGKNDESFTLNKGQPVFISSGNGANPLISLASNTGERTSSKTLGLMAQSIAPNEFGYIITEGLLEGFDTSSGFVGDPMWLGQTGNIIYGTGNKPYGNNHLVSLGIVLRAQSNNGKVYVKVQNGFEIDELHKVYAKNPQDKYSLLYDSASGAWISRQIGTGDVSGIDSYYLNSNPSGFALTVDPVRTTLTGNGATSIYAVSGASGLVNPSALIVAIDGALQEPVVDYTVASGNVTFTSPLASGSKAVVISPTNSLQVSQMIPADGSVTSSKLDTNLSLAGNLNVGGQVQLANQAVINNNSVITASLVSEVLLQRSVMKIGWETPTVSGVTLAAGVANFNINASAQGVVRRAIYADSISRLREYDGTSTNFRRPYIASATLGIRDLASDLERLRFFIGGPTALLTSNVDPLNAAGICVEFGRNSAASNNLQVRLVTHNGTSIFGLNSWATIADSLFNRTITFFLSSLGNGTVNLWFTSNTNSEMITLPNLQASPQITTANGPTGTNGGGVTLQVDATTSTTAAGAANSQCKVFNFNLYAV